MFPVCPLCCFILISMDLESEINDDDDDDYCTVFFGPVVYQIMIPKKM